jgi:hypothetical protein
MAGKTMVLRDIWSPDGLGCAIARRYQEWQTFRQPKIKEWEELRTYIFATDTSQTSNSKLPWKNKTTVPKLCQIRDNLLANYMASIFPKRKNLYWEADSKDANSKEKRDAILNYMGWVVSQDSFKNEVTKLILDYIDYGNVFVMPEWVDESVQLEDKTQVGYVGPAAKRISPLELVMNPISSNFKRAPKIIRSLVTIGEVKKLLESQSTPDTKKSYEELWTYLKELRNTAANLGQGDLKVEDHFLQMDGFMNYRAYLESDYCELLTFYGDLYDAESDTFLENHVITVVDRHKIILKQPNPSYFGTAPIFHAGWRKRQDNLWAMGPLDNLVGLQYRIDHIENMKADVFDLITFPPLKIKGYVSDFEWGPFARIHVGDDGDVEMMAPPFQVLTANQEIMTLQSMMEEMAGSPKEAAGFRTPGEKTAYEVQRLENAASRIFQNKIAQFEEQILEPLLNAMLELARRNLSRAVTIPVFDPEFDITIFDTLSAADITGAGKIKPVAARHFAEQAELVQNLTAFYNSKLGEDPSVLVHISGFGVAKLIEENLNLKDYGLVQQNIRLAEEADSRREAQAHQEKTQMEAQTPSGLTPDDSDGGPLLQASQPTALGASAA